MDGVSLSPFRLYFLLFLLSLLAGCEPLPDDFFDQPSLRLSNGQAAVIVIGQGDFHSFGANQGGSAGANTLHGPGGNVAVHDGRLFLADAGNNRVLAFEPIPAVNNDNARFVLGQADFTSTGSAASTDGSGADRLHSPVHPVVADGRLLIADQENNRVLIWNRAPNAGPLAANVIVGQEFPSDNVSGCTSENLNRPLAAFAVDGTLLVADSHNHRVLIWNSFPTRNGARADLVLGQSNMTSCQTNRGSGAVGAHTLNTPTGIWSDGTRLFIADSGNHRVLVWNSFPTVNGAPADTVLGQPDLTSNGFGVGPGRFNSPVSVNSNGRQLFVADHGNHRVLVWNRLPTAMQTPADIVLGQPDMHRNKPTVSAVGLSQPVGVTATASQLIVSSLDSHRVLIYNTER